jgi:hypothetical protein
MTDNDATVTVYRLVLSVYHYNANRVCYTRTYLAEVTRSNG